MGPSPAPGSWMHRFSSSMPSCKTRNSALARLLVLLPRRLLALGAAEVAGFEPCASFRCGGLTDVALVGRLLQHVLHLDQLSLVVLHVLDERASVVIDAEDFLDDKLLGEVFSEEGGEGRGGDVGGGESEDAYKLPARIVALGVSRASILEGRVIIGVFSLEGKWVPNRSFEEQETRGSRCISDYFQQHVEED